VLAVADAYSAMTTTRPYRKALTPEVALARIAKAAGSQLDPVPAMTFVKAMRAQAAREAREAVSRQSAAGGASRRTGGRAGGPREAPAD
jgi:HD-GYP domain-containing protein (c-di-GMP phosphodiesterase class II)